MQGIAIRCWGIERNRFQGAVKAPLERPKQVFLWSWTEPFLKNIVPSRFRLSVHGLLQVFFQWVLFRDLNLDKERPKALLCFENSCCIEIASRVWQDFLRTQKQQRSMTNKLHNSHTQHTFTMKPNCTLTQDRSGLSLMLVYYTQRASGLLLLQHNQFLPRTSPFTAQFIDLQMTLTKE